MKPNLPDIIRENKDLQQILQNQKGGIMKFWAEHLDVRGPELFKNYQDQCDAEFFEDHEWDFAMTLSRDEMKCKALGKNHIECELGYLTDLKIALSGVEPELSSLVITYAEKYLTYAYDEKRKRNFPNGMAPKDLYEEVVGLYRTGGLANDCMKIVLIEHNSPGIIEETPWYRNTMFNIKMKSSVLGNWRVEPDLRLAVADMLDGKTSEECRYLAVKMMKEVKAFSQMLYSKNLTTVTYLGFGIDIIKVDKEWLRDVASHAVLSEHNKQKKSARYYFSHFVFLLMQIGRIWAAQLANHSVDMHDLEVETGCILKPAEKGDYDYYVDNLVGDNGLSQRFVVDENHARKLLSKIKHVDSIILETQKEEKEQDNFNCQVFNRPVTIIKNRPTSFHQEQRSKYWPDYNNHVAETNAGKTEPPIEGEERHGQKKLGAKETKFVDYIINNIEANKVIDIIKQKINKSDAKQTALVIIGGIEAGKIRRDVTAPCIEKEFGVNGNSVKPHLTKYRAYKNGQNNSFSEEELKPYKDFFSEKD